MPFVTIRLSDLSPEKQNELMRHTSIENSDDIIAKFQYGPAYLDHEHIHDIICGEKIDKFVNAVIATFEQFCLHRNIDVFDKHSDNVYARTHLTGKERQLLYANTVWFINANLETKNYRPNECIKQIVDTCVSIINTKANCGTFPIDENVLRFDVEWIFKKWKLA
jgi:hypothetical protein